MKVKRHVWRTDLQGFPSLRDEDLVQVQQEGLQLGLRAGPGHFLASLQWRRCERHFGSLEVELGSLADPFEQGDFEHRLLLQPLRFEGGMHFLFLWY